MSVEIRVPVLGESIVDATIASWLKKEGETVRQGEPVAELETDKINVEAVADQDGILQQILKQEGENVSVGEVLAIIGEAAPAGVSAPVVTPTPAAVTVAPSSANGAVTDSQRAPSPLARRIAA